MSRELEKLYSASIRTPYESKARALMERYSDLREGSAYAFNAMVLRLGRGGGFKDAQPLVIGVNKIIEAKNRAIERENEEIGMANARQLFDFHLQMEAESRTAKAKVQAVLSTDARKPTKRP